MIKTSLVVIFFLVVALDEFLNIGLLLVPGLSAKNAFLYVILLTILLGKATTRSGDGVQFMVIHVLFLLLIAQVALSIFFMHFVSGDTAGIRLFQHIGQLKSNLLDMYLMFLVFFYGVDSRKSALNVTKFFLGIIGLVSLLTLMDVLKLPELGLITYRGGRLEGPLGQANEYGVYLAFFIPILILAGFGASNWFFKTICLASAAVSMALLIQTGSRGGLVSMVAGTLITAWWLRGGYDLAKAVKGAIAFVAIAGICLTVVLVTTPDVSDMVQDRIARSSDGGIDDISAGRTMIWAEGLDYQMARPWTLVVGVGYGTFWNKIGIAPHSAYMNYFFSLGFIGLGLYLALLYRIFLTLRQAFFSGHNVAEERLLLCGLVMGWFALAVAMSTGTIFKAWLFVWPITGLCLRIAYCLQSEESARSSTDTQPEPPAGALTRSLGP